MREDNAELSQTVTYTYDKGGNITEKSVYPFTTGTVGTATDTIAYTYDSTWKDKLTSYDGTTLGYNEIGDPDVYTHDRVFIWSARDLLYAYLEDGGFAEYRYNENGLRSLKIIYDENRYDVDGYYYYFWSDDGRLLAYTVDQTGSEDPYSVLVLYNSDKEPIGFTVGEDTYYYLKNIQGDVLCVTDAEGTPIINYTYDAWGAMTVSPASQNVPSQTVVNVAFLNPVTYRGYFYDYELGLYYLQSRYYDPETGRFISADDIKSIDAKDCNYFAYCYNNPINYVDFSGKSPEWAFLIKLGFKGLYNNYLCVRLFVWGFTHREKNQTYNFSNECRSLLIKRLKKSSVVKSKVNDLIKTMNRDDLNYIVCSDPMNFYHGKKTKIADLDLMLSIGDVQDVGAITISITKSSNKYYVCFSLNDEFFDFGNWDIEGLHTKFIVAKMLNNVGRFVHFFGVFVPYHWKFSVSYEYT